MRIRSIINTISRLAEGLSHNRGIPIAIYSRLTEASDALAEIGSPSRKFSEELKTLLESTNKYRLVEVYSETSDLAKIAESKGINLKELKKVTRKRLGL